MEKVIFIDRDGTINKEVGYLHKIEDCEFIPGAVEAIRLLNENQFKVVVVTNQAGVARGYYSEADVQKLHNYMNTQLNRMNANIDLFCYCPFHPEGIIEKYKKNSVDRKPDIGMLNTAAKQYDIDKLHSWMIGDSITDIQAGKRFGIRTILVATGYGQSVYENGNCLVDFYERDIYCAVRRILEQEGV